ncbi:MAG: lipoprotein insertase outer membrane protein LolB [Lysobacter sp.]|nr:lipoprotein insertase outer membrane protein LolB [Lysobacter sp.]
MNSMRGDLIRRWMIAASLAMLAACAAQPTRQLPPMDAAVAAARQEQREAELAPLGAWSLQGRVALSNGRDGGSGRIDWRQEGAHYEVALSAPVTRQSWRLSGDATGAQLEGLEGGTRTGPDATSLLLEATRWEIPVAALASWARGVRAESSHGAATIRYTAEGRLARIEQGGWVIDYSDWRASDLPGIELPTRLNAVRGDARVRLIVDRWGEGAATP